MASLYLLRRRARLPRDPADSRRNVMKTTLIALAAILLASPALAIEPIPGSITYGGQPHARLQKSPVGSTFVHRFDDGSYEYEERYVVQPDHSLRLVSRVRRTGSR